MTVTVTGMRRLGAPREVTWDALHDLDCLQRCIPACRSIAREGDGRYLLTVLVEVGPIRVAVDGTVEVVDDTAPSSLTLRASGAGRLLGSANGTARLALVDEPRGCRLTYMVEAQACGPLRALGPFALARIAKTLTDQFVANLAGIVGRGPGLDSRHAIGDAPLPAA